MLKGAKSQPLVDHGFNLGLAFAAGFPEAFSSSWIGMASLTNLSIRFTVRIQDTFWSWNKDWTWTSIRLLQTGMSETRPKRTLLWIHPLIRVPSWSRGIECSRQKDWFYFPLGDGRAYKNCPISTNLKPASEHSLDNFWSSDIFSNRCSYSCSKFPCRSSLAFVSARRGCVIISTLSSWPGALGFSTALWPTGNSSIISATSPLILGWLMEMTTWRTNSMFCVLTLKCIDFSTPPLLLDSRLSKALVPRNTGWPDPARFSRM